MKRFLLIAAVAALCCLCTDVNAASLSGRVIEVSSGDVITVFNLNRPVRVKLLGIDAPELGQEFGDVAKKHLSDLVYDKSVLVEYSGISADGSLGGRVLLDNTDIGAQMIRDGAAWVDPNNLSRLSGADREIYQQSEQAARNERRGLWQAHNPIAPWEFVKAKALRTEPRPSVNATAPSAKARSNRPYAELTNLTLMTRGTSAPAPSSPLTTTNDDAFAWASAVPTKGPWQHFRPVGEDFSAFVPQNGKEITTQFPLAGEMIDMNLYVGRDGLSAYLVQWLKGKSLGESDSRFLNEAMIGFSLGLKEGFAAHGMTTSTCGPANDRNISVGGNAGIEFELTSCAFSGRIRIVTKVADGQRRMYVLAALYMQEDDNVNRFLNSLTMDTTTKPKPRQR